jgi:cytidine deaminase
LRVGAALLASDGQVIAGCNVENASFGLTLCAERTALVRAVAEGRRRFARLAVVSSARAPLLPCGACLQALAEHAPELEIVARGRGPRTVRARLAELLPAAMRGAALR